MIRNKIISVIVCLMMLVSVSYVSSSEGELTVEPVQKKIMRNDTLRVDIRSRGLKDVYALSFEISYEAKVLSFKDYEWGSFLEGETKPGITELFPKTGKITVNVAHIDKESLLPSELKTVCMLNFVGLTPSEKSDIKIEKVIARTKAFESVELSTKDSFVEVISSPTKPKITVIPEELDFGSLYPGDSKTLTVKVKNIGKEGLKGTTECNNIWLSAEPINFKAEEQEISITVNPPEDGLRVNKNYKGRCEIFSNGGTAEVLCKYYLMEKGIEDVIPPDLTIDEPKEGMITNKSTILLKGRTNPGAQLKINRMPREVAVDGSFEHELMLNEGLNKILFYARNDKGGVTEKTIQVTLDTVKPVLLVTEPKDIVHTNPLRVEGITEPGVAIKFGSKPIKAGDDGKFAVSFPLESGANTLSLTVVDAAGNEATWSKSVELVLQEEIKISMWIGQPEAYVNGVRIYLQVPPTIKNGRTFVPVRFVSESLRSEVKWDGETRSVTVVGPEHTCILMIDQTTAFLDGQLLKLDAAPFIQNSTTLVPLRFIAQDTLNGEIGWDGDEKRIDITVTYDIN